MNNLRIAQRAYDDMNEPEYHDFDNDPMFLEFVEYVTLKLLSGENQYGIDSEILLIELELAGGGYQMASEIVSDRVTERDYRAWLDD